MTDERGTTATPHRAFLRAGEAVQRLELLASVSRILAPAMEDYHDAVEGFAEACVPDFCDLCVVEVVDDAGGLAVVAARSAQTSGLVVPERWSPVGRDCSSGRQPTLGYAGAPEPEGTRYLRESLRAESLMLVPLSAGGVALGWLVLATGPSRRGFRPSALQLATDLAARLTTALQRVHLYRETVFAARAQEASARRLRRLAAAAAHLAGADTARSVLRTACMEACLVLEGEAAVARWVLEDGTAVDGDAGSVDGSGGAETVVASALAGQTARTRGWIAYPLPCTDERHSGALAIAWEGDLPPEEEVVFRSLASLVPVAFERALSMEASLTHEAQMRAVLEASPVAIVGAKSDGEVVLANKAAAELFAWDREARSPALPESVRSDIVELVTSVTANGAGSSRPVVKDGFDLSVAAVPMPAVIRQHQAVLLAATDLRESRRVERALLQAQRLEAMGQVTGGIAHDFNNLLTVILGFTKLLEQSNVGFDEAGYLGNIERAAQRAATLTRQLLGISRSQLDRDARVNVAEAVRRLQPVLTRLAGASIRLDMDDVDDSVVVRCDAGELEQTILNLAINACDAMAGSGRLVVRVRSGAVSSARAESLGIGAGDYGLVTVADSGGGMSEQVKARCFEPFFSTKGQDQGSGLGLWTVYTLARESGGAVTIDSQPGQGATVTVLIPQCPPDASVPETRRSDQLGTHQPAGSTAPPAPDCRGRVLLVEDEDDLRALAMHGLTARGFETLAFESAEAALDAATAGAYDILVTDIVLPGMDGVALAHRLREEKPGLAVLYLTGYADRETRRRGLVDGAELLRKPYDTDELCGRVASLLEDANDSKR